MSWRRRRTHHEEQLQPARASRYVLDEASFFAFLETDVEGGRSSAPVPDQLDRRVFELVNDDWDEPEAIAELVQLTGHDRQALVALHRRLQAGLLGNPWFDPASVRASRVVLRALRAMAGT